MSASTLPGRSPEQIARVIDPTKPPTPEQAAVIGAPLEPLLVVAGAGSGKTETMAHRVLWLLDNHPDLRQEEILCLTFTRKAAGEIADRVRDRLTTLQAADARAAAVGDGPGSGAAEDLGLGEPTMSTYHAYAASLVREHGLRVGVDPEAAVLTGAGQWQLANDIVEGWTDALDVDSAATTVTKAVIELAGSCAEHLLEPAEIRTYLEGLLERVATLPREDDGTAPGRPFDPVSDALDKLAQRSRLVTLVEAYVRRKRERGVLDFGDQVALAARLARLEPVRAAERRRFRVVLLDEYQDTSVAQLELLSTLFGSGHPVTAVGDPHQAIYGWRGASAGGLERFPRMFPHADGSPARELTLSVSWRNPSAVLEVANTIAAPLREGSPVVVPELRVAPHREAEADRTRVRTAVCPTLADEVGSVVSFLREHWHEHNRRAHAAGAKLRTAAVLCRRRSQFEEIVARLRAAGFEPEVVGLGGLLDTPEVADLVAALQVAHDPSRGDSLMRLLTGPWVRLGSADVFALGAWSRELAARSAPAREVSRPDGEGSGAEVVADVADQHSLVDALDRLPPPGWTSHDGRSLSAPARDRLHALARTLEAVRGLTYLPVPELIGATERLLGLDIELMARPGVPAWRARAHVDELVQAAHGFAADAEHPTLGAFLAWLEAARSEERGLEIPTPDPVPGGLQVLTVHAAKGLEWDVVAVPGMVDGVLPSGTASPDPSRPMTDSGWLTGAGVLPYPLRGDADEMPVWGWQHAGSQRRLKDLTVTFKVDCGAHEVAEERRLAYVAVTRAREHLLLSASWWRTGKRSARPSTFLRELVAAGVLSDEDWAPPPAEGETNPALDEVVTGSWPSAEVDPARGRAAQQVRAALRVLREAGGPDGERAARLPGGGSGDGASGPRAPGRLERAALLLLEERSRRDAPVSVAFPAHLSASALVELAADPAGYARALRRPVPQRPSAQARRGTAFHAWVERYFGAASLVDVDELPGADDETAAGYALADLQENFLTSPWAGLEPVAVEVDVQTPVAGAVLRCRIDAVFPREDGGFVVLDWKSGTEPRDPTDLARRQVQLAAYRLAWARYAGVSLAEVDGAFFFAATGRTVHAARLLGEEEIEALLAAG